MAYHPKCSTHSNVEMWYANALTDFCLSAADTREMQSDADKIKQARGFGKDCIRLRIHNFEQSRTGKLHVLCAGRSTSSCEGNPYFMRRTGSEIPPGKL